jgi:preprotein translocase subunit SecD
MFVRNWKLWAVIAVFVWSLTTLIQVVPDKQLANWQRLAELAPSVLQEEILSSLEKRPDYKQMNQFQIDQATKEAFAEVSQANNIQVLGHFRDFAFITNLKLGLDLKGGSQLLLQAQPSKLVPEITPEVMRGVETVINNRVNSLGVSETVVQRAGRDRLIVELPGVKDPQAAKDRIGTTALLEFKELAYNDNGSPMLDDTGSPVWRDVNLTGADFKSAQAVPLANGRNWVINFHFKPEGAKKFGDLTSRLVGKQIGIFLDGLPTDRGPDGRPLSMQSYHGINVIEPIRGGDGEIKGSFTKDQAVDLASKLNAGSLPTKVVILEERTVGATLGQDSIDKSLIAGLAGIGLVMLFMLVVYGVAGLVANTALILYTLTTLAVFKAMPVTLTLAGIAGFILSIGMAVDANILIFERTKEELNNGKNLYSAIEAGFEKAFSSIFDSNMNSLIACSVLMAFGTSVVKGFAVTLGIGVAISMFSAITATRVFLHLIPKNVKLFGVRMDKKSNASKANAKVG